jgi:hypothetical protein
VKEPSKFMEVTDVSVLDRINVCTLAMVLVNITSWGDNIMRGV